MGWKNRRRGLWEPKRLKYRMGLLCLEKLRGGHAMLGSSLDLPSCPQPPMFYRDVSDRRSRQHHQVHLTAVAIGQWRSLAYGSADKACLCNTESQGSNWIIHRDGITSQSFFRISDASNAYCYRWMALRCRSGCLDRGPAGKVLRRSRSRKMLGKCLQ